MVLGPPRPRPTLTPSPRNLVANVWPREPPPTTAARSRPCPRTPRPSARTPPRVPNQSRIPRSWAGQVEASPRRAPEQRDCRAFRLRGLRETSVSRERAPWGAGRVTGRIGAWSRGAGAASDVAASALAEDCVAVSGEHSFVARHRATGARVDAEGEGPPAAWHVVAGGLAERGAVVRGPRAGWRSVGATSFGAIGLVRSLFTRERRSLAGELAGRRATRADCRGAIVPARRRASVRVASPTEVFLVGAPGDGREEADQTEETKESGNGGHRVGLVVACRDPSRARTFFSTCRGLATDGRRKPHQSWYRSRAWRLAGTSSFTRPGSRACSG
jgi:hypothetical protein